jgi:hypothetical protein
MPSDAADAPAIAINAPELGPESEIGDQIFYPRERRLAVAIADRNGPACV